MTTITKETFWTQIVEDPTLYGTITTEDNLFNYRSNAVWQVMNETFISNGTNFEVTKWEELLGLNVTETTLNGRKTAILNHITENLPITIGILEELIKELTDDDYELVYNETENKLTLGFPVEFENDIKEIASRLIPIVSKVDYITLLPAGYLAAEFLESTGTQYIVTEVPNLRTTEIWLGLALRAPYLNDSRLFIGKYAGLSILRGCWRTYKEYATPEEALSLSEARYDYYCNGSTWTGLIMGGYFSDGILTNTSTGEAYVDRFAVMSADPDSDFTALFGRIISSERQPLRCFYFRQKNAGEAVLNLVPALDSSGRPCMFDAVSKQPLYNSNTGEFIVGMTMEQAHLLDRLPPTDGSLTISLPEGYESDAGLMSALETARSNGWTLTIQTYTTEESTSTASTFGMQRIWVRKTQDDNGSYVDANENRFQVEWCVEIYSPENKTPEDLGYEQFRSVDSAVEYWELTPYINPTLEEQFNITNEEQ